MGGYCNMIGNQAITKKELRLPIGQTIQPRPIVLMLYSSRAVHRIVELCKEKSVYITLDLSENTQHFQSKCTKKLISSIMNYCTWQQPHSNNGMIDPALAEEIITYCPELVEHKTKNVLYIELGIVTYKTRSHMFMHDSSLQPP